MLLHIVRGPTSYADLKTVDGHECATYREACQRHGLLENDNHWVLTMEEACTSQFPVRMRHLFSILLTTCSVSNPLSLWDTFKTELSEDILLQTRDYSLNQEILELFYMVNERVRKFKKISY